MKACLAAAVLYVHIFYCTHERDSSSPMCYWDFITTPHRLLIRRQKSASFIKCSWHVIAELLAKLWGEAHLYSSPKCLSLVHIAHSCSKPGSSFDIVDDRMRYVIAKVVWSISNYHILWKKVTSCLLNDGMGKNTSLEYVFWGAASNISFYGQESCSWSCLLYVYNIAQIFAVVHFEAPPACPHVEVRNHTNMTHSATPSKHTQDIQCLLNENTFCLVSKRVSTLLGSFPGKKDIIL